MWSEHEYIEVCKEQITDLLKLNHEDLSQRDFEFLHNEILNKTNTDLSTATLRRIWTNEYQSVPQAKTLDALGQLLGHIHWHAFKAMNEPARKSTTALGAKWVVIVAIPLLFVVIYTIMGVQINKSVGPISFEPSELVHEGVPATIGFDYDIKKTGEKPIFIELSWNPNERALLDPKGSYYSGTYFYPDYHQSKLLFEDSILISKPVHITTKDWHGLIMKPGLDPTPIYLDQEEFLFDQNLVVSQAILEKYGFTDGDDYYPVFTKSSKELEKYSGDNFSLSFSIQNLDQSKRKTCKMVTVLLKGETGMVRIPISQLGCYGLTHLNISEVSLSGKTNDLSTLSTELSMLQPISISSHDNSFRIQVGDNEQVQFPYQQPIGKLKVVKFIFDGYGEVSDIMFGINS